MSRAETVRFRVIAACLIAGIWATLCYLLVDWVRPDTGMVSLGFAMVQPAAICAFLAWVSDPLGRRGRGFYLLVPVGSAVAMILISILFLQEGAICVAMYSPLWIGFGVIGSFAVRRLRPREAAPETLTDTFRAHGLLVLPLMVMALETAVPAPVDQYTVTREVVIDAPVDAIWPLMCGMGAVAADEGQWNVSQSVLGLPRPRLAALHGEGLGAARLARWDRGVVFSEVVDQWQPGRRIGWQFDFAASTGWDMTDRHLRPDGPNMVIRSGGYDLRPTGDGRQILRLTTHYTAHTHFNAYAALWGELLLGDVQGNVLAIIRQRAEAAAGQVAR